MAQSTDMRTCVACGPVILDIAWRCAKAKSASAHGLIQSDTLLRFLHSARSCLPSEGAVEHARAEEPVARLQSPFRGICLRSTPALTSEAPPTGTSSCARCVGCQAWSEPPPASSGSVVNGRSLVVLYSDTQPKVADCSTWNNPARSEPRPTLGNPGSSRQRVGAVVNCLQDDEPETFQSMEVHWT